MGYFVDIPKPKAWPPPRTGDVDAEERTMELLAYGAKRDPVGDKVHLWFACLFMFCLPVATGPASVSLAMLFGYSLLRLPTTWRSFTPILQSTLYWLIVCWMMYLVVSVSWSSNPTQGWDHAKTMLSALAVPFLLWPVVRHWKWFIIAGLAGVALQNAVQGSEVVGSWFLGGNDWLTNDTLERPSGFTKHQGTTAIYMATAVLLYCSSLVRPKMNKRILLLFAFALFGVVVVQSRATWVGLFVAGCVYILWLVIQKQIRWSRLLAISGIVLAASAAAAYSVGSFLFYRASLVLTATDDVAQFATPTSSEYRVHWWTETTKLFVSESNTQEWLFGNGLGSCATIDYSTTTPNFPKHAAHPHNMFVQTLYEGGLLGFLFLSAACLAIVYSCFLLRDPLLFSILLLWLVVAFFDGSQNSGRSLTLLLLLVTGCFSRRLVGPNV